MSNNNLGTFLKKRSLFANSPQKTGARKRSNSREPKDPTNINSPIRQEYVNNLRSNPQDKKSTTELRRQYQAEQQEFNYSERSETNVRWPNNDKNKIKTKNPEQEEDTRRKGNRQIEFERQDKNRDRKKQYRGTQTQQKMGRLSQSYESIQCLEGLSVKIQGEISSINYKLEVFNNKMNTMITNEFKNLRERIFQVVQKVFLESEKTIRSYMKIQEDNLAGEMIKMKQNLEKQYIKIESMKEDINKPGWRKVAGELLSSEMEQTLEQMLRKSSAISIGHWQIGDLGGTKLRVLEEHLKDIVKLQK